MASPTGAVRTPAGRSPSRLYAGCGLSDGHRIRNLVGHEFTGNPAGHPGLEVVADENLVVGDALFTPNKYTATIYPGPKNNVVFNASTMWWGRWLNADRPVPYPSGGEPLFVWAQGFLSAAPHERVRSSR